MDIIVYVLNDGKFKNWLRKFSRFQYILYQECLQFKIDFIYISFHVDIKYTAQLGS